jgi:predicted nuclease with RNAse H fold
VFMLTKPLTYVGVDPTAARFPFTLAALNQDRKLIVLAAGDVNDVLAYLTENKACVVAVNAPPRPNHGLVRKNLEKQNLARGQLRGSDMRQAESELRAHGISVSPTPARVETCPAWMQMGFDLFHRLDEAGFKQYPTENAPQQWLETHPHAAFCALLGQIPLSKPTLEGRLQRQIALYEQGIDMKDPMEFFEEITRHKLLLGSFPMELVYTAEELDAMMAAYMAFCVVNCPQETIFIGDHQEGQIALPVVGLKERYS